MILAIETSTPVCSVALGKGSRSIIEKRMEGRSVHSERTFEFIKELLDRHELKVKDLDAVLFSNGPGSYTGLRIGASAIKGLLFQQDVPLYTLPTLLSFSIPFLEKNPPAIHAVIDARRQHLYHQKVRRTLGEIEISKSNVVEIETLQKEIKKGDVVAGTGWDRLEVESRTEINWFGTEAISAKNLVLGWNHPELKKYFKKADVESFEPEYLTLSQVNNSEL
ncbi:tRNA (adenosine(37)-N6)-threonylcarbamoyltransferase complex dimerization subunit type 1 TsaB [Rhodohalobacter sp. 614A]|uniref:tRNA (adenosine(37)-N6)-threonylcarbamoyltransferase complex dimerization subunit type 1 TsaB n=1 Tax=Rhodohalobacter sp. 614A TaxID=2908649 RepID=UPI001F46C46A|nr:tRNA (adenosine(37)-N6)-threonylcarbamoyltransferase complex dimerization subunit type 1 TsaB [Rhodohalobacter sp. 614A]